MMAKNVDAIIGTTAAGLKLESSRAGRGSSSRRAT